jgi:type VI protein secretion system component VasK
MLSDKYSEKANPAQIASALKDYWFASSKLPKGLEDKAQKQLTFWSSQVDRERFPRITLNDDLVTQARLKLKSFPAPNRFYKQKVAEITEKLDKDFGKMSVQDILNRNSADSIYLEGTYVVPSAFTREGYKLLKKELSESGDKLSEPDWVLGETTKDASAQTADVKKIEELYFTEYAARWVDFVKDTKVKPYNKDNVQFAKDSLTSLSSPTSPLKVLAKEIAINTNFSSKAAPAGWWAWMMSLFESKGIDISTGGNTEVERQFLPLSTFVGIDDDKAKPPIESYQSQLAKVAVKFGGFSTTKVNQVSQELAKDDDKNFGELKDSSEKIKGMVNSWDTNGGQALARLFQQPLENLKALFGAGAKEQIQKNWTEKVLPESGDISKSYPFDNSGSDIDLKKLSEFLNPKSGTFSTFYKSSLAQYFDETNDGVKPREDSEVKFTDEFVGYLNNTMRLQKALFGADGATPKFDYEFTLGPVKDAVVEVTIDGQKITSDGTGSNKISFPASSGETGVFMRFASTEGTTTTAPPVTNANTSTSPVSNATTGPSSSANEPQKFPGTWGLFKFFDAGKPEKQDSGEYNLTYSFGGKSVTAKVKPTGGDLFDRKIFTAMRAPENIFK